MTKKVDDSNILETTINSKGTFEFNGEVNTDQLNEKSGKKCQSEQTEYDAYEEKMSAGTRSVADSLRSANESYLAEVRNQFEVSRKEMMEMMSSMTSIKNVKY